MFDLGAVIKSDWTHIQFMATYTVTYMGLSGVSDGNVWKWQNSPTQVNGLQYNLNLILAYQFPSVVKRVGVIAEFTGQYDKNDFGKYSDSFNGDFMTMRFSPFVQLVFSKNDSLSIAPQFSNRRGFTEEHFNDDEEIFLTYQSDEWYFKRIGASWTHLF